MAIFLFLGFSHIALSQTQISFRQLSVKDGLSQNSVVSVVQDSVGYLWMATQNGLNRYDGRNFKTYPFDFIDITRPTYSHLGKIYIDKKGDVFIIPLDRKVYKLDRQEDVFKPIHAIFDASSIYQDKNGRHWVGTYTNGIYTVDSTLTETKLIVPPSQLATTVYSIAEQSEDEILAVTDRQLIEIDINSQSFQNILPKTISGEKINQNYSASLLDDNEQWIATFGGGLYCRRPGSSIIHKFSDAEFSDPLPTNLNILDLHLDQHKRLWLATYGSGLYMIDFEVKRIQHFTTEKHNPRAIHYNDVLSIHQDYTGTLWFGTDGAGLSFYDEFLEKFNSYTNLQTPENISIDVIRAITVAKDKSVWLGTSGKGLTHFEPAINSWRTFTTINSEIPSSRIVSLFIDNEDDLWVGTQGNGLAFYNEKTGFRKAKNISAKTIWNIFKDALGRMWLGTQDQGLIQFSKSSGIVKQFTVDETAITSNTIRDITQDPQGNLWIGTDTKGLLKFNSEDETFTSYVHDPKKNAISGNGIKSLYYDKNDILWIGTNGDGLSAYDTKKKTFHHFTENDGLANDVVYAVLPDDNKNLWLSSNKGITRFSADTTFKNPSIKNYNNYAGLATEFNTGAYFKGLDGELYFGGLDGFYWFNPNNINENLVLPKTTITSFEVLNTTRPLLKNTNLNHNENTITFTFSSLQYALPEKNLYQYRLSNFDDDWIFSDNNNIVRYSRLPPGNYEFQVKSSNYDGIWNETPASFNFTIKAPWYFNFYSKLVYALIFLLVAYSVYQYFKWRWQMKLNLRLKEEEAQRLKKLNDYKSKLYTDIAHEFRTPLTLISAPIDAKLTEGKLSDYDFGNFSSIKRNTNRLTALVDQLLQLAKLEKGKLNLTIKKGDLGLFLQTIIEPFEYKAKSKDLDFISETDKFPNAWYDEDVLEKIVSNLMSNAIKYASKEGFCSIKAKARNEFLHLEVENSIDRDTTIEVEKLFERFYQKDQHAEGVGVGLSLVKELLRLYKGTIEVVAKDERILFKLELPVKKKAFDATEVIIKKQKKRPHAELSDKIDLTSELSIKATSQTPILLVVEDHEEVRVFIKKSLRHKYQILEAVNGQEGVEKALEHVPDIILSDVRMPVKDGIILCNTLKSDERTSHIPIVLLTADIGEENELRGLESGADDFITKPFKLRILEKRLENLIGVRKALRNRYSQEYILNPTDISLTSTDEVFLNKIQQIIDSDFSNPDFNAVKFSKKIGMSRMQLHRKLLAYTGLSTSAFIRSQRLKLAVEILKNSDATVNEVAYSVGFNTPSYFIKCFKEAYQKTPSEYLQTINK